MSNLRKVLLAFSAGVFTGNNLTYNRKEKSSFCIGRPGTFTPADRFPISNVVITPDRYSYEGNWLFCTFTQSDIVAARIGFGRGKMDWRDYGLDEAPISENSLFIRIEIITAQWHLRVSLLRSELRASVALKCQPAWTFNSLRAIAT